MAYQPKTIGWALHNAVHQARQRRRNREKFDKVFGKGRPVKLRKSGTRRFR